MKSALAALASILGLATATATATDLRPVAGQREGDGPPRPQLVFTDGPDRLAYLDTPRGWAYSGTATRLTFTPDWTRTASASILRRPIKSAESLPASPEERLTWVKARLPREAEKVAVVEAGPLPMEIDGAQPIGITYRYTLVGRDLRVTLWLLDRESEQLQFMVESNDAEHGPVFLQFRRTLFSLNWAPRGA